MIETGSSADRPDLHPLPGSPELVEAGGNVVSNPDPTPPEGDIVFPATDTEEALISDEKPDPTRSGVADVMKAMDDVALAGNTTKPGEKTSPTGRVLFTDDKGKTIHDYPDRPERGRDY